MTCAGGDGGVHHRLFGYAQAHVFQGLLGILSHHVFRLGDCNILGAQAHGQGDLLALLDSTAGLGVLLDDGAGWLVGIFFSFCNFSRELYSEARNSSSVMPMKLMMVTSLRLEKSGCWSW